METTIETLIQQLAAQRARLAAAKEQKRQIEASPAYVAITAEIRDAAAQTETLTTQIKELALSEFSRTGSKEPHPGIKVKMITHLRYDLVTALNWARVNLVEALTLDVKFFETHAKGVAKTTPVPCVSFETVPEAQLSADLSRFLDQVADLERVA